MPAKRATRPKADRAVLLTPGASATRDHSQLVAIDQALSDVGIPCRRIDLPARAPKAVEAVKEAAAELARDLKLKPDRLVLGGRSFGGRMCSMAVAEGLPALGLVLVSYPLHPPGKPDNLRTAHFPDLRVPCLFLSGDRDPFGTRAELEAATGTAPGGVEHQWVVGGDHGLRGKDQFISHVVAEWVRHLGSRIASC